MKIGPCLVGVCAAAAMAAPAVAQPGWEQATPVEVVLSNFAFTPAELKLTAGQPYRLHLVNRGSAGHSFSAPAFFAASHLDPEDAAALRQGRVELRGGETRDIRLIPALGAYPVQCSHFMHAAMGMKGRIVVESPTE